MHLVFWRTVGGQCSVNKAGLAEEIGDDVREIAWNKITYSLIGLPNDFQFYSKCYEQSEEGQEQRNDVIWFT